MVERFVQERFYKEWWRRELLGALQRTGEQNGWLRCAERRQEEGTNLGQVGAHHEAGIVDAQHITLSNL